MALFQRRQDERAKAERLAKGEAPRATADLSREVRTKIMYAIIDAIPAETFYDTDHRLHQHYFCAEIRAVLLRAWGKLSLAGKSDDNPVDDLFNCLLSSQTSTATVLDIVEASFVALLERTGAVPISLGGSTYEDEKVHLLRSRVNDIFDEHDVAFQVVGNEVISRNSMALHANVVGPALTLLHGEPRYADTEKAFQNALRELKPSGSPEDAITDAGTALQEMLRALGCSGNALGPLLDDAKRKGLLGPYDSKLAKGVELIGDWVSADRSTRGDPHNAGEASPGDAWLAVHVAGALIARLAKRG